MLFHPGDKLAGMIGLLECVLGKDRLPAPVVTERIAQAQCLRKFTRLVDELVDPLQIVRARCAGQALEERPLTNLRPILLGRFDQPLHARTPLSMRTECLELYVGWAVRILARHDREWVERVDLKSVQTKGYRSPDAWSNFVPSFRTSRGVMPKRRLNERLK